jgi:hypothetical protein
MHPRSDDLDRKPRTERRVERDRSLNALQYTTVGEGALIIACVHAPSLRSRL